MAIRSNVLIVLLLLLSPLVHAQGILLRLDDEPIKSKASYGYYPHKVQVAVVKGSKQYTIKKGTLALVLAGKKIHTEAITEAESWSLLQHRNKLPGAKLVVEVQEVADHATGKTIKLNAGMVVHFQDELKAKPHPDYKLLLNHSTAYLHEGLDPKALQQLEFVLSEDYHPQKVLFYHARGRLLVREEISFDTLEAATLALQQIIKDASVQSGDRILVELIGKRSAIINIPIKY